MKIFVLEDDIKQQAYMESTIQGILEKNGWECQFLEIYGKPDMLIDAVRERGSHQIFFLDIEIKQETQKGLEVAGKIRKLDPYALDCICDDSLRIYALDFSLSGISF